MAVFRLIRTSFGTLGTLIVALLCVAALSPAPALAADSTFTINGRGWGHGIGLSQYGAKGYADQGKTYDWILRHYFQKTGLSTRVELTVKVDLDSGKAARTTWDIAAGGSTTMTVSALGDPTTVYAVPPKTRVWVAFKDGTTRLYKDRYDAVTKKHSMSTTLLKAYPGQVVAATGPQSSSMVKIMDQSGPFAHSGIVWRGIVRFSAASDTTDPTINYVGMENYLRGVVPRESPSSWPAEALKAQAVAARSYAFGAASNSDILWCTTMSQVYGGYSDATGRIEQDSTDDAISATVDEVVTYDSAVVKTFFSSSSGGKTANSKDVWFTDKDDDTSPVYYTSVADEDDTANPSNPNYRWTPSTMSGSTLAGKIRDYDNGSDNKGALDFSVASPATITDVSLDPGTSGFVRYITLKWSNGKSFAIKGPSFQSALRLKSSAFTVTVKKPASATTATRFQQPDSRLAYAGTWTGVTGDRFSGGSYRYATKPGATVTAAFKGTRISWIGTKSHTFGKAEVYLDGVRQTTVDLYSSSALYQRVLWTKTGLSADTTHTLVITVLGTHGTSNTGTTVGVDAFDVTGTLVQATTSPAIVVPTVTRIQQPDGRLLWTGTWTGVTGDRFSGGSYRYATKAGATVTAAFKGTRISWIGTKSHTFGKAEVYLDGVRQTTVDLYSLSALYGQALWTKTGLSADTTHTLVITVLGTHGTSNTGTTVGVDAFDVTGTLVQATTSPAIVVPTVTRLQESDGRLLWTGAWTEQSGDRFSGGSYRRAAAAGAKVTAAFKGTGISWIGVKSHTFGKASVSLDGGLPETIDLYAPSALYQRVLWTKTGLSADTTHTLVITVLGTHGTSNAGTTVGVDAFDVLSLAP